MGRQKKEKPQKKPVIISDVIISDNLVFARASSQTAEDTYPIFFNFNTGEGSCRCQGFFFNNRCEHIKALILSINRKDSKL